MTAIGCPNCTSTEVVVAAASQVTFTFGAQGLANVHMAGVLDGLPDTLACNACGYEAELHPVRDRDLLEVFYDQVNTRISPRDRDHLQHGIDVSPVVGVVPDATTKEGHG